MGKIIGNLLVGASPTPTRHQAGRPTTGVQPQVCIVGFQPQVCSLQLPGRVVAAAQVPWPQQRMITVSVCGLWFVKPSPLVGTRPGNVYLAISHSGNPALCVCMGYAPHGFQARE